MANISYGGHSFIIDGQHTWLACGAIDYARIPHALWRDRVRAARQAGPVSGDCCSNRHHHPRDQTPSENLSGTRSQKSRQSISSRTIP